jgi:hypothetical protein
MITTEEGLNLALEQLGRVYKALAALRSEHPQASESWLALMSEGWIDQAQQLRREIEQYAGVKAFEESEAELWLAVEGRGIAEGKAPTSVLTAILDALRKGVQAVAEFLHGGQLARRPPSALQKASDWTVLALHPGSLKIGVRLPDEPGHPEMWEGTVPDVRRAVREFLDVAAWAASEEIPEALATRIPDLAKRRLLLNSVKPFVPRPRGTVESVTITGRLASSTGPIILTRAASGRISLAIDRMTTEQVEEYVGDLREIDLDNLSIVIRYTADVREIRCNFDASLLETAREALDRRVQVVGIRRMSAGRASPTLHVFRLDVLDEAGPAEDPEAEPATTTEK